MRIRVCSALAAVGILLVGCGSSPAPEAPKPEASATSKAPVELPDISNIKIHGDEEDPVNKMVMHAISDLESYWGEHFPELYGSDFTPIEGGYFAVPVVRRAAAVCHRSQ